jgi:uncharacterized lipoprotein YddW (UPF0748 family)
MHKFLFGILILSLFTSCNTTAQVIIPPENPVQPKREFRGVWVATVENIDWPKTQKETSQQQQQELVSILDAHQKEGMNAIMFQARPAADAFYAKGREPWSKYLNGMQGRAPDPFYDPLEFAINEAHKRGMELHAWFNPYRATKNLDTNSLAANHITRLHPEWFFIYGNQKLFDPGLPEVREYIVKVILDVVDNYDVDGIHMDDYFYPYHVAGQTLNDAATFAKYGTGFTDIGDWRRANVDTLIKMLNDSIHKHKPLMKFGLSPSGVWANKSQNPEGSDTRGGDSYYSLYADSKKWVQEGWVDYINPQIYRVLGADDVAFDKVMDWWTDHTYNRHLYIGMGPYRIIENKLAGFKETTQFPYQVRYLRANPRIQGSVYFSSKSLLANPLGFTDSLKNNYYRYPALPPVMLWRDSIAPKTPRELTAKADTNGVKLSWKEPPPAKDKEPVYGYVIYRYSGKDTINVDGPKYILHIQYNAEVGYEDKSAQKGNTYIYVVTAIDRLKNESEHSAPILITLH